MLANRIFTVQIVLTVLGALWAIVTNTPLLGGAFIVLLALASVAWLEWRATWRNL